MNILQALKDRSIIRYDLYGKDGKFVCSLNPGMSDDVFNDEMIELVRELPFNEAGPFASYADRYVEITPTLAEEYDAKELLSKLLAAWQYPEFSGATFQEIHAFRQELLRRMPVPSAAVN
jgi:hypothetical protein